ncbi:MAG: hypothetical protein FJ146_17830 [Deltaproteobacteria bacterium]|nr:hypothetical protein [Deltaproteobacteria bacterium]
MNQTPRDPSLRCVYGYVRVSTNHQLELSPRQQSHEIRDYCTKQGFPEPTEIFIDEGVSGLSRDRVAYKNLMATVRPGDAVIVLDISRLGRRAKEVLGALEFFKDSSIRFVSIRQQLDSSTLTGQFTFSILACVNEMMANDAKQRTKLALDYKRARREKLGGAYVPFGFDCPDGKTLVPNTNEHLAILAINKLQAAGWSLRAIGSYLSERGIKTKSGRTTWHPETIRKLIRRTDRVITDAKVVEVTEG